MENELGNAVADGAGWVSPSECASGARVVTMMKSLGVGEIHTDIQKKSEKLKVGSMTMSIEDINSIVNTLLK